MSLLLWCLMPRLSTCKACQCPHPILTSSILDKAPVKDLAQVAGTHLHTAPRPLKPRPVKRPA